MEEHGNIKGNIMGVINIAYATDNGYLTPTLVSVASALAWASNRENIHIHVLDIGIDDESWISFERKLRSRFGETFSLTRHVLDVALFQGLSKYHNSLGSYARLFLPQLLKDVDWCVYCDGDTLFVNDPFVLQSIYDDGFQIQGWLDHCNEEHIGWLIKNDFGFDEKQYVCTGFMLLNLETLRKIGWTEKCLSLLRAHPDAPYADQEAINSVSMGEIGLLPDEWGIFSRFAFRASSFGLIHYALDVPWKLMLSRFRDYNDGYKLWFLYARELLELKFGDLVVGGINPLIIVKKLVWRIAFKAYRCLAKINPMLLRTSIGDYCSRHYATSSQWKHLCSVLGD